jgi:hypothetical protein
MLVDCVGNEIELNGYILHDFNSKIPCLGKVIKIAIGINGDPYITCISVYNFYGNLVKSYTSSLKRLDKVVVVDEYYASLQYKELYDFLQQV